MAKSDAANRTEKQKSSQRALLARSPTTFAIKFILLFLVTRLMPSVVSTAQPRLLSKAQANIMFVAI